MKSPRNTVPGDFSWTFAEMDDTMVKKRGGGGMAGMSDSREERLYGIKLRLGA